MLSMPLQALQPYAPTSTFYPFTAESYFNFTLFPTFYIPEPITPQEQIQSSPSPRNQSLMDIKEESIVLRSQKYKKAEVKRQILAQAILCNCSRTGCQKDYCRCFKAGKVCGDHCNCQGCKNCSKAALGQRRRQGKKRSMCNCRKTRCSSKYCDCLAGGGRCGSDCSCINCQNQ